MSENYLIAAIRLFVFAVSKMRKLLYVSVVLMVSFHYADAQKEGLNSINKSDLKSYMTFFASDELEGRETGTRSNEVAALYIKTNLMRIGLKPIPATGDYFQMMPLLSKEISNEETYLKVRNTNGDIVFSTDSLVYLMTLSETIDVTGNVVFVGYGPVETDSVNSGINYGDLKNKIVLVMTGYPEIKEPEGLNSIFDITTEEPKIMSIIRREPKAILYVYNPHNKFPDAYASGLADMAAGKTGSSTLSLKSSKDPGLPLQIAFITQHTADMLLKTTGYSLKQFEKKIIADGKPVSVELNDITASVKTSIKTTDVFSPNVIGMIEGSDPVLKNECVIYTAHFDHDGVNDKGETFNGADDDASGSMALLEVARAFMNLRKKPLRSIVFAWVNGEEKGLLGSKYYADYPVIPMEKTLLDINLDMVGRSKMESDTGKFMGFDLTVTQPGEILVYTAHESNELLKLMASSAKETGVRITDKGNDLQFGSSDHASFQAKGVPALLFISGIHSDLHSIRDDVDKIDFDKMEKVSKMVFLLGYKVANQKDRFKLDK